MKSHKITEVITIHPEGDVKGEICNADSECLKWVLQSKFQISV